MKTSINKTINNLSVAFLLLLTAVLSGCKEDIDCDEYLLAGTLLDEKDMNIELPAEGGEIEIFPSSKSNIGFHIKYVTTKSCWNLIPTAEEGIFEVEEVFLESDDDYFVPGPPNQMYTDKYIPTITVDDITVKALNHKAYSDKLTISAPENNSGRERCIYIMFPESFETYHYATNNAMEVHQPSL